MNEPHAPQDGDREDLSPHAEKLLEFLQDREGIDYPLQEIARCLRVPELVVLVACRELYAARDAVTVTVTRSPLHSVGRTYADDMDAGGRLARFWNDEQVPMTTRGVGLECIASEDEVLEILGDLSTDDFVLDVVIRAEVDPRRRSERLDDWVEAS